MNLAGQTGDLLRTCDAKHRLARAGEPCEMLFVVTKGLLIRERVLTDGRRQIVGSNVPGDVCGLAPLINGHADHDLIALSPVAYIPVTRHQLSALARNSADLSQAVWREMAREAAISAAWITNLGQRPSYERIAHFICELEARLRAAGENTSAGVEWPGSQSDLGAAMGLSLVHVNKILRHFELDRSTSKRRCLRFYGVEKLRERVDFDPSYLQLGHEPLWEVLLKGIGAIRDTRGQAMSRSPSYEGAGGSL